MLEIIKEAALQAVESEKPTALIFGTVESTQPLKIRVSQKLVLEGEHLLLSRNVTDYETKISFNEPEISQKITIKNEPETEVLLAGKMFHIQKVNHKVTIYNGLKEGEKVCLLRMQGGNRYFVWDRVIKNAANS